jgi:hypothetical protein
VLLISGESGVGKRPFVRALRALAEVPRGRWLHGECYAEGWAPYSGFDQALGSLREVFGDTAAVEKLSSAAQDALRIAAVIGREFDFEALRRAGDFGEEPLLDALDEAQRAQIIAEVIDQDRRQAGQETFRFLHNLIALTLREDISRMRRRRLHRRVGEVIEALRPGEHAALAYHFSEAGDDTRAAAHFRRAGDAAKSVYANSDAIKDYCCALDLTPDDTPERFDVLLARARTYNVIGHRTEQKADSDEMLVLWKKLADDARRFEAVRYRTPPPDAGPQPACCRPAARGRRSNSCRVPARPARRESHARSGRASGVAGACCGQP